MTDIISELKKLENAVGEAKSTKSMLEGKLESLMDRLHNEFQVKTTDEAKNLLADLRKKLLHLEDKIKTGFEEIRENFEW